MWRRAFQKAGVWKRDSKKRLVGGCPEGHEVMVPESFRPLVKEPFNHELLSWPLFVSVITAMTMDAAKVNPGAPLA